MKPNTPINRPPLPRAPIHRFTRPIQRYLQVEASSGIILIACTTVAMAMVNSPLADTYHHVWETTLAIGMGDWKLEEPLHFWVNDGLMTLFFFVVGLEIKRELVDGELSSLSKASLPIFAAAGGMLVPAGIFLALQFGSPGQRGWGIPMATDIAFVVGILALFGKRVPFSLKIFLLSLAIADDIGAILVIAIAYSSPPDLVAAGIAVAGFGMVFLLNRLGVRPVAIYFLVGVGIWLAVLKTGIHPTVAGVVLGLMTPTSVWVNQQLLKDALSSTLGRVETSGADGEDLKFLRHAAREAASPVERLLTGLHGWVGYVIMPVFALANAGVEIRLAAVFDPLAFAVGISLVVGKPLGIFTLSFLAVKLKLAQLPSGVSWRVLFAAGCLGGIGFTMSLFITTLALPAPLTDAGKIGIILGSAISAVTGVVLLRLFLPPVEKDNEGK